MIAIKHSKTLTSATYGLNVHTRLLRQLGLNDGPEFMRTIESALDQATPVPLVVVRPHRTGDMGWVLSSQAKCYAEEYGWGAAFEALVAEIIAQFLRDFDPVRERCWIAEVNGSPVGSVFLVKANDEIAKLRLLMVEPHARGAGIGRRLVEECIRFARAVGYRRITLWTHSILTGARVVYQRAGFHLVHQEPHCSFGHALLGETWDREL